MADKSTSSWYDKFCSEHEADLPLFYNGWYLDAVCSEEQWDVAVYQKNDEVKAIWPYYKKTKYGLSYITMPPLTPYLGPWVLNMSPKKMHKTYSYEHTVLGELCDSLPQVHLSTIHTHPEMNNLLATKWKGYQEKSRYTYRLDLGNKKSIWDGISDKQRNIIRKAQASLTVSETEDIDQFYEINKKSFQRQDLPIPYGQNMFKALDTALKKRSQRLILEATDKHKNVHGMVYLAHDRHTVYLLAIGSDPQYRNEGSIPLMIWHAIQHFNGSHQTFDFEGSMIPTIEKFFRSFGGNMTKYSRLSATKHRGIDLLLTLTGRNG